MQVQFTLAQSCVLIFDSKIESVACIATQACICVCVCLPLLMKINASSKINSYQPYFLL